MVARALLLAFVIVVGVVAVGPAVAPSAANHQCVMEPCTHGPKELLLWVKCQIYHFMGVSCPS